MVRAKLQTKPEKEPRCDAEKMHYVCNFLLPSHTHKCFVIWSPLTWIKSFVCVFQSGYTDHRWKNKSISWYTSEKLEHWGFIWKSTSYSRLSSRRVCSRVACFLPCATCISFDVLYYPTFLCQKQRSCRTFLHHTAHTYVLYDAVWCSSLKFMTLSTCLWPISSGFICY